MRQTCSSVFSRGFIIALAAAAILAGCETAPKATNRLDAALDHYQAQRFSQAHQHAVEVARSPAASADEREQAAYVAGLAAFRSGDTAEAELRLAPLTSATDTRLAGSAQAVLGQIRLSQKRATEAAALFDAAAAALDGDDARQARRYAAVAHHEAGNHIAAAQRQQDAGQSPPHFRGGFTLQVGAFNDPTRADQAAAKTREIATGHGLGPVMVRQSADTRGRPLFLVQFGHFPTRQAAAQARSSLGRLDYIVAPMPRG